MQYYFFPRQLAKKNILKILKVRKSSLFRQNHHNHHRLKPNHATTTRILQVIYIYICFIIYISLFCLLFLTIFTISHHLPFFVQTQRCLKTRSRHRQNITNKCRSHRHILVRQRRFACSVVRVRQGDRCKQSSN